MALFSCCLLNFPWYGMITMVLSTITFSLLITKVSQDLAFIRRIPGAVNETAFWFACWVIYISFLELVSALTHRGVSLWQGVFSSIIPYFTIVVGIFLGRDFIIRFYYTSVNWLGNLHTLKHVNSFLKLKIFKIKSLHIGLIRPAIRHTVSLKKFDSVTPILS